MIRDLLERSERLDHESIYRGMRDLRVIRIIACDLIQTNGEDIVT